MGSSQRIAKGIFWTTASNIVNGLYGFISVPILISYFGKEEYSLIGLAMSINVYISLIDLGFDSTNVRFFSNWIAKGRIGEVRKLFQTSMSFYGIIGLFNAIILIGLIPFSKELFNLNEIQNLILSKLLIILSISAFVNWYTSCFDQLLRSHELVGWSKMMSIIPRVVQLIILWLTIILKLSVVYYFMLTIVANFVILPFLIIKIRTIAKYIVFTPHFHLRIFKMVLNYSLNIFFVGVFTFTLINLRPVILGINCDITSIADYRILDGITKVVILLGGAFVGVFLPSATKALANKNEESIHKLAYKGTEYITISLCFCCFCMISIVPEIICAYVGDSYLYLCMWLDLWLLATLGNHNQAISSLILAGNNLKPITYITIISSIIGLVTCWLLTPIYIVGGTVISYLVYLTIQMIFYYSYYWPKYLSLNSSYIFKHSVLPYILFGFIGAVICRYVHLDMSIWESLFVKISLFSFIYILLVYVKLDKDDLAFFRSLIHK